MKGRGRARVRLAIPYFAYEMKTEIGAAAFQLLVDFIDKATAQAYHEGIIWCICLHGAEKPFEAISHTSSGGARRALKRLVELGLVRYWRGRTGCIWFVRGPKFSENDVQRHLDELPVRLPQMGQSGQSGLPQKGQSDCLKRGSLPASKGAVCLYKEVQDSLQEVSQGKPGAEPGETPEAGAGGKVVEFVLKEGKVEQIGPSEEDLETSRRRGAFFRSPAGALFWERYPDPTTEEAKLALDNEIRKRVANGEIE